MARLFFATVLFIFTLIIFIVSIIYMTYYIEPPIDINYAVQVLIAGLIISFSGGSMVVFALIIIKQATKIMTKKQEEYENDLPREPFISFAKIRRLFYRFFNQKRSIIFIYISALLIFIITGGIIWKIVFDSSEASNSNNDILNKNESNIDISKAIEIPSIEVTKINGTANINTVFNTFSGKIYNGLSNWTIVRLVIRIEVRELDDSPRWIRDFEALTKASPLSLGLVEVNINEVQNIGSYQWSIAKAWGYKSK